MPKSDESEDGEVCEHDGEDAASVATTAQGDEYVADQPAVVATVPATPKAGYAIVVAHAANHILRGVNVVKEGPQAEEAPWKKQL